MQEAEAIYRRAMETTKDVGIRAHVDAGHSQQPEKSL